MTIFRFYVIAALINLTLSLAACKHEDQDPRLKTPLVRVMTVPEAEVHEQSFTGIVMARVQSNLGFRVSGKIVKRFVDTGQTVKAGQPLMRIDRNDLALAVAAKEEVVKAAKAHAIHAIADEARYKALSQLSAASRQTYELAKATADSARAQLAAAEAEAQIARNQGDYSLLVADANGTIVETLAEPGQVVNAGQTVIKLAHAGPREASVDLPETVRPALNSTAQAAIYGSFERDAVRLRQLSDSADPQTRTFEARYVLDGKMAQAPLGATVTLYLPLKGTIKTVEVPLGAITDEGKGPGVWVLDRNLSAVSFRPVEIASLTAETAILKNGVMPKDQIVSLGAHLLHEGEKVRIAEVKGSK